MKKYIDGDFEVTELDNGSVIRQLIPSIMEEVTEEVVEVKITIEDRLTNIENTMDLLLLMQEGIL